MKIFGIFVVCLLICRPTFGEEHDAAGGSKASSAHSGSEGMESDDDGNKSGDSETGESMRSDDDSNSMNMNGNEGESDDTGTSNASLKSASRATTSALLRQLHNPSATTVGSVGAGADTQRIVEQLLSPADSPKGAGASAAILMSASGGSMTAGDLASATTTNAIGASGAPSVGKLSATTTPEPATGLLLAMSPLPWILRRRGHRTSPH